MIGYIYKISCLTTNKCYIGQTINIKKRLKKHMDDFNNNSNDRNGCRSKKIFINNNWKFEIIHRLEYNNKTELNNLEEFYIFTTLNSINFQLKGYARKRPIEWENIRYKKILEESKYIYCNCCNKNYIKYSFDNHELTYKHLLCSILEQ